MEPEKTDLLGFSPAELSAFVETTGQKPFRARQLRSWIFEKAERDFARMTNLSADFRRALTEKARVGAGEVEDVAVSADGRTVKFLFRFDDGARVEAVSMRDKGRHTACLSSQVGCAMGCAFCATGGIGFRRNLVSAEMLLQAIAISARAGRVTNVVFMGMGEPLLNLDNTLSSVAALTDADRFGLGARKITISTCGIVPGIRALALAPVAVRLALSLNSPFQEERARLMPVARRYPLASVLEACDAYASRTGRRVTIEYVLFSGLNTGRGHAAELARIARRLDGKINLIEYNTVGAPLGPARSRPDGIRFEPPKSRETLKFRAWLEADGAAVTIRFRRGREIAAGCGQLAAKKVGD